MNILKSNTETKRKAGQPEKPDAKQPINLRLHPDVIKIIKAQPNQSTFIENLVLTSQK